MLCVRTSVLRVVFLIQNMRHIDFAVTRAADLLNDREQAFRPQKPTLLLLYGQEHVHNIIVVKKICPLLKWDYYVKYVH